MNVFITGANGGIGRALITKYAQEGYDIIAHVRRTDEDFLNFTKEVGEQYNANINHICFEITDSVRMKTAVKELMSAKIAIDVLVNNAGVAHGGFFQMTPIDKVREVFEVNLFGMMELTQLILKSMVRNKKGAIVNIASIAGIDLLEGNCAYGLSKASVIAFTKNLSKEVARFGIRVNAVAPGLIDTKMATLMEKKAEKEMIGQSSMNRLGNPSEIADAVFYLSSEKASFVNGEVLRVSGG